MAFGEGVAGTRRMPDGDAELDDVVHSDMYHVDKTMFLKKVMFGPKVLLFTRPRRFGKTWTLNMANLFFNRKLSGIRFMNGSTKVEQDFFEDTNVSKDSEFCEAHRNRYPVIFLNFKDVCPDDYGCYKRGIARRISNLFNSNRDLLDICIGNEVEKYGRIVNEIGMSDEDLCESIEFMTGLMHRKYGEKTVILIDEYENSIHKLGGLGTFPGNDGPSDRIKAIGLLRLILGSALKNNEHLKLAIVTGITEVVDHDIFSGLNNVYRNTILTRDGNGTNPFGDCFGYTIEEARRIVFDYGGDESDLRTAVRYYDGYDFGAGHILNPLSFNGFVNNRFKVGDFWAGTSDNSVLLNFSRCLPDASDTINRLLTSRRPFIYDGIGGGVSYRAVPHPQDLFTLMAHAGYLNASPVKGGSHMISLPNRELAKVFRNEVLRALDDVMFGDGGYPGDASVKQFCQALLAGDAGGVRRNLQGIVSALADPKALTDENALRMFVAGMTAMLLDRAKVVTEAMSGDGYADLVVESRRRNQPNVVVEFKRASGGSADLEALASSALGQT